MYNNVIVIKQMSSESNIQLLSNAKMSKNNLFIRCNRFMHCACKLEGINWDKKPRSFLPSFFVISSNAVVKNMLRSKQN